MEENIQSEEQITDAVLNEEQISDEVIVEEENIPEAIIDVPEVYDGSWKALTIINSESIKINFTGKDVDIEIEKLSTYNDFINHIYSIKPEEINCSNSYFYVSIVFDGNCKWISKNDIEINWTFNFSSINSQIVNTFIDEIKSLTE